jgi:hypothetical protein
MRCGNPSCTNESAYFRSGSLHCVDLCTPDRDPDMQKRQVIWLCHGCSMRLTVESWRPAGQQLRLRTLPQAASLKREKTELPLSA